MDLIFDHLLSFVVPQMRMGFFTQYFKEYRILVRDKSVVYW